MPRRLLRCHWSEGRDVSTPDKLAEVGTEFGIDGAELIAATSDDRVKARHREWVDLAIGKGVFGAPSFIVDGELFWGSDKIEQVDEWIETGGWM